MLIFSAFENSFISYILHVGYCTLKSINKRPDKLFPCMPILKKKKKTPSNHDLSKLIMLVIKA